MNDRDELAREVFIADNSDQSREDSLKDWAEYDFASEKSYAHNIADGLIAAGYRKPRTITTVEELDALPSGAVVHSDGHVPWEKFVAPKMWAQTGEGYLRDADAIALPATVLWEPLP